MPWRTESVLNQRMQFVMEYGQCSHSELCRRYGISRTAGYKWIERFRQSGLPGLKDRSRRPHKSTKVVSHEITVRTVAYRQSHPSWGASKIRKILLKEFKDVPSRRTLHRILQECNLVTTRRMRRRRKVSRRTVVRSQWCNHIWTTDFKGWWRTRDGKKVFPLTIRDEFSKMVLAIEMLPSPSLDLVKEAFIRCFLQYGLPELIRSDNGCPFSYSQGLCGLSRLSAWWISHQTLFHLQALSTMPDTSECIETWQKICKTVPLVHSLNSKLLLTGGEKTLTASDPTIP
ncbi:MAG: transposase [Deltaproteobacteria bacterium]|nr:transposase [Deltaproteobacteria bacterium]